MLGDLFDKAGYDLIPELVDKQTIKVLSVYFENVLRRGYISDQTDRNSPTKICLYADPFGETLLASLQPKIEEVCGKELLPTYSFFRVYQPGEELPVHTDRPSCEISVTLNIASVGEINKIWMEKGTNEPSFYTLAAGDAVAYKGCEIRHWREPIKEGQLVVQLMLHYVDKHGPYADYVFDERKNLGFKQV